MRRVPKKVRHKRIGRIRVSWGFIASFLPAGSKIVDAQPTWSKGVIEFTITHPDLEPVAEGERIPRYEVEAEQVRATFHKESLDREAET